MSMASPCDERPNRRSRTRCRRGRSERFAQPLDFRIEATNSPPSRPLYTDDRTGPIPNSAVSPRWRPGDVLSRRWVGWGASSVRDHHRGRCGRVPVTAMLLVRRRAPDGSYFHDGDRAAGVFGVLATGFAVLLGFVVFLAFESYDEARSGAEREALVVAQQVETAQFFAEPTANELTSQLVCYARSVVGVQWDRMENGTLGEQLNPFAAEMFRLIRTVEPGSASEQSAYDRWHDQTSDREEARNARSTERSASSRHRCGLSCSSVPR